MRNQADLCTSGEERPIHLIAVISQTASTNVPHSFRPLGLVVLAAVVILSIRCASRSIPAPDPASPSQDEIVTLRVEVKNGAARNVKAIPLEDYVRGTVPVEMPLTKSDDIVTNQLAQLQAILSRTYALANRRRHADEGFDLCSTTHCQVYAPIDRQPPWVHGVVLAAVTQTKGLVITDGTGPINALFHADCGGRTSSATAVWGGAAPNYLSGVRDTFCVTAAYNDWEITLSRDHLRRILNTHSQTAVGNRLGQVTVTSRDSAGRASMVLVRGETSQTMRGERFRRIISEQLGARAFRSTLFQVTASEQGFRFVGQGFGHGVGLCQTGAIIRTRNGSTVDEILAHYYPGTTLEPHTPPNSVTKASLRPIPRPHPHSPGLRPNK